jgi:hypothetical protein
MADYPQSEERIIITGAVEYQTECPQCHHVYTAQVVDGDFQAKLDAKWNMAIDKARQAVLRAISSPIDGIDIAAALESLRR